MTRVVVAAALVMGVGVRLAGAWLATTNGDGTASDNAYAVAVDGTGDVVAAGATGSPAGETFTVVKHRGTDGALVWKQLIGGTGDGSGRAVAVGVDGTGAVVAAGTLNDANVGDDFAVVKLDAAGAEVWRQVIDGDAHTFDSASALAVDAAGNVAAAGNLQQATSTDIVVVLWNAAGVEQWRRYIDGVTEGSYDTAASVTFDVDGNVVVTGTTDTFQDIVVAKWNAAGDEQWRRTARGSDPTFLFQDAAAVRTDSQGNVVVAGDLYNLSTGFDFTVITWDPSGTERWRRSINGSIANSSDSATALAIDGHDAVVAVGITQNEGGSPWTAVKWSADGAELWRRVFVGDPALQNATPAAVATDAADAVIAAGSLFVDTGYSNLVVVKSASDGPELWRSIVDGSDVLEDVDANEGWAAVAIDPAGHVLVAGTAIQEGSAEDFTVAKLDGATGGLTICGNGVIEAGEQCDPGGDLVGDCCTAACTFAAEGSACEDGDSDACTAADVCAAGVCQSGARSCGLDVPSDPIPVAPKKPIVPLECEGAVGALCKAVLLEAPAETAVRAGAAAGAAAGPRPLSRKAKLRIRGDGRAMLKLKLNARGRALLQGAGNGSVATLVRATISDRGGATRTLEKTLLLRRR